MQPAQFPEFHRLFDDLTGYCLSYGVGLHDSEDLVGSTLEAALTHFDPERGEFRALCFTTLKNLMKNHWRDKRRHDELPKDDNLIDPYWWRVFVWDTSSRQKEILEKIVATLTPDEKTFLEQLTGVFAEMEDRAVSEAARRLGLTPEKGWDVFRRIQRKARKAFPEKKPDFMLVGVDYIRRSTVPGPIADQPFNLAPPSRGQAEGVQADVVSAGFDKLLQRFEAARVRQIESLLLRSPRQI